MFASRKSMALSGGIVAVIAWLLFDAGDRRQTANARQVPAKADDRQADREAIRKMFADFRGAFQRKDAAAAVGLMTNEAEIIPDEGQPLKGREAIQKAYATHFAVTAKPAIVVNSESLRFTGRDAALEDGHMTVTREGESPETHRYHILYVREDGKWLISLIKEWPAETNDLDDLAWLIGTWKAKQGEAEIHNTYEWFGNKAFIKATIGVHGKRGSFTAMQIIGADPTTGELRTWTFEHDGGLGEGSVVHDGPRWVFENRAVLAGQGILETTNILVPVDRDTITWQPINLTINGEPIGNLAPMKLTRVK